MKRNLLFYCLLGLALCAYSQDYLRLMTYNVHNAKGGDGVRDLQRIADVILDAAPDVVAIQEVDSMTPRCYSYQLGELAARTGMHARFAPALHTVIGRYGIGVLSREAPLSMKRVKLPGAEEKRVLLIVEFKDYIFCCTHLSLTAEDRMRSLELIRPYAAKSNKPFFLAGDFNAQPESEFMEALQVDYDVLNDMDECTFSAYNPYKTIDYIVSWKPTGEGIAVVESQVIADSISSDHRPVLVTLRRAVEPEAILSSGPFLQYLTGGVVSVAWVTRVSARSWVEYAVDGSPSTKEVVACPLYSDETVHSADIIGVSSGDTLRYRICSQETLGDDKMGHIVKSDYYTLVFP